MLLVAITLAVLPASGWAETCGSARFGPKSEIRHNTTTHPGAIVLDRNDNWASQIENGRKGQVFLLDNSAGSTFKVGTLKLNNVEVYPNDCDLVKIDASSAIRLGSNAVLAGFELDLTDSSGNCIAVRDSDWGGRLIQKAVIRGNDIYGGEGNCIDIRGETEDVQVLNNHVNGGFGSYGLTLSVRGDGAFKTCNGGFPQRTRIENNLLEKNQTDFPGGSAGIPQGSPEDHVTFAAAGDVMFRRNILRNQGAEFNGEEYMDLKYGCDGGIYTIERNFFYGPSHREPKQGCLLVQTETTAYGTRTHVKLRGNIFYHCNAWNKDKDAIRFGAKSPDVLLGDVIGNLIIMEPSSQAEAIRVADTKDLDIEYNTMHRGKFVFSSGVNNSQDTTIDKFRNNLFMEIDFAFHTTPQISACTHQVRADGTTSMPASCTDSISTNPQVMNSRGSCDHEGHCTFDYTPTSDAYLSHWGSDGLSRGVFLPPTIARVEATSPHHVVITMNVPRREAIGADHIASVDTSKMTLRGGGAPIEIAHATVAGKIITLTTKQAIGKSVVLTLETQNSWCKNDLDLGGVGVGASCLGVAAQPVTNRVDNDDVVQILPPLRLRVLR